jgi:hypothetical protein
MRYALLIALALACSASAATVGDLRAAFEHPPDNARIMVRWWWFGPSQTKAEIEREMREMKSAGIGGFEVQPVYPLSIENNYSYLSAEFLEMLRFAAQMAKELGMLGSGWPFGGPHVPITQAAGRLRIDPVSPMPEDGDAPYRESQQFVFHVQPHAHDCEARGLWRGRICAGSLRPFSGGCVSECGR